LGNNSLGHKLAASSVSDASYRVIDIAECDGGWSFRMQLKTLDLVHGQKPAFVTIDEQSWRIG
jgi:hypothetical protein